MSSPSLSLNSNSNSSSSTSSLQGRINPVASTPLKKLSQEAFTHYKEWKALIETLSRNESLAKDAAFKEELKQFSLLEKTATDDDYSRCYTYSAEPPEEDRLLAHILGDSFVSKTDYEGLHMGLTSKAMINAVTTLAASPDFNETEKAQLKHAIRGLDYLQETAQTLNTLRQMSDYSSIKIMQLTAIAQGIAQKVKNLKENETLLVPGGWAGEPGHSMIYEFKRNGLRVYNTGAGLEYHDLRMLLGNKFKYQPVLEFANLPDHLLFCGTDTHQSFFFQALLEPRVKNQRYTERYIYGGLLEPLMPYLKKERVDFYDFISEQRSGTCSWKVITALLRTRCHSYPLYKKAILHIQCNTLIAGWNARRTLFDDETLMGARLRQLFRLSARQLNKRLAKMEFRQKQGILKLYAPETLKAWVATTVDMLDQLTHFDAQAVATIKAAVYPLPSTYIDKSELENRAEEICKIEFSTPHYQPTQLSSEFCPFYSLKDPATFNQTIREAHQELLRLIAQKTVPHASFRASIEHLAAQLPLAHETALWEQISQPEESLEALSEIAEIYTQTAIGEFAPTFTETLTFFTFYSVTHLLTVKKENSRLEKGEIPFFKATVHFQEYPIYDPMKRLHEDLYFFSTDQHGLKRLEAICTYFTTWNSSVKKERPLFHFEKASDLDESLKDPDLQFYDQWISDFNLENQFNSDILKKYFNISPKLNRLAHLHGLMENSPLLQKCHLSHLIPFKRLAFFSLLYSGQHRIYDAGNYIRPNSDFQHRWNPMIKITPHLLLSKALQCKHFITSAHETCLEPPLSRTMTRNSLLAPMAESLRAFILLKPFNTRHSHWIPLPSSEASTLSKRDLPLFDTGKVTVTELERILLDQLERTAADPLLQPSQVIYSFRQFLSNLGGQKESLGLQSLFFTLFFKTLVSNEKDKMVFFSPAILELTAHQALLSQAEEFIQLGLNTFWVRQPNKRPLLDACLFFIQLAQRIRLCQQKVSPIDLFMKNLEKETLDVWVKQSIFSPDELASIHLHRLHGYSSLPNIHAADEADIPLFLASWVYWQHHPVPHAMRWPDMERQVESFVFKLLPEMTLKGTLLQQIGNEVISYNGIQLPSSSEKWEAALEHPIYRLTTEKGHYWEIDLATGRIANEIGIFKNTIDGDWHNSRTFRRLFADKKLTYQSVVDTIYFQDAQLGQMRHVGETAYYDWGKGLQSLLENQWCQYVPPVTLKSHVPNTLLSITNLWLEPPKMRSSTQGRTTLFKTENRILICPRDSNIPFGYIETDGKIIINKSGIVHGVKEGLELRQYNENIYSSHFHLDVFERREYIELYYFKETLKQISFPRYHSRNQQPLTFVLREGKLIPQHDHHFCLAETQHKGLLPAVNNYLLLVDRHQGIQQKLLVPCQQLQNTIDLSPHANLDVKDADLSCSEENELDVQHLGRYRYLEYTVQANGELAANHPDEQLFLAYLYLQARDYPRSFAYLNQMEKGDILTPQGKKILKWIYSLSLSNHDYTPSAIAIALHAFLKANSTGQNNENSKITQHILSLHKRYATGHGNIEPRYELEAYREIALITLLHSRSIADPLISRRMAFLKSTRDKAAQVGSLEHPEIHSTSKNLIPSCCFYNRKLPESDQELAELALFKALKAVNKVIEAPSWTNKEIEENDFWALLKIAFNGTPEEKSVLKLRLNLNLLDKGNNFFSNTIVEQLSLLEFLIYADPKKLKLAKMPEDSSTLREKAEWIKQLADLYKPPQSSMAYDPYRNLPRFDSPVVIVPNLKSEPWQQDRPLFNLKLGKNQIGTITLAREQLFKAFFKEGTKGTDLNSKFIFKPQQALIFSKEEMPFAKAITKEFEEFEKDYQKGGEQIRSGKFWEMKEQGGLEALQVKLADQQEASVQTLKQMEIEILKFANIKFDNKIPSMILEYGGLRDPLILSDLVLLFLKQNQELLKKANPNLTEVDITHLYQLIGNYLVAATESQTLTRALVIGQKIEQTKDRLTCEYLLQQMAGELSAERVYNFDKHPEYLVFEYCSNMLLREKQMQLLTRMLEQKSGKYVNRIEQLIMGGGKTSVLAAILCHLAAKPNRLSLFITPSSQFETVKENLKVTQRRCFNQAILALDFHRDQLTPDYLVQLLQSVTKAMESGELVLIKVECLQMLELELINSYRTFAKTGTSPRKLLPLHELLSLMRNHSDAFIDEVDVILNALHTVNFPDGIQYRVAPEQIELMREIYKGLASSELKVDSVSMKDFIKLTSNQQTLVNPKDILEKIAPVITQHLAVTHEPLMQRESSLSFVRYVTGKMNPELEDFIEHKSDGELAQFLAKFNEDEKRELTSDLQFLKYLRRLFRSQNPREKEAAHLAAITKHVIRTLLPVSFSKSGGRHYGRTLVQQNGKAVPYLAVGTPSTTEFGYHYEALCYQFQTALQCGISKGQIKILADNLRAAAEHYVQRDEINFDKTAEASSFEKMTHVKLSEINLPGNLDKAVDFLTGELAAGRIDRLLNIEAETAIEVVKYYSERLESTAQAVISQVDTARGVSGTPWNWRGYHKSFKGHVKLDEGTEGQIAYVLSQRFAKNLSKLHTARTEEPGEMLRTILTDHPQKDRVRGFMDPGGIFKKTDNETVARSMLKTLQETNPAIAGVLFFYRPEGSETADTLALLRSDMEHPIMIEGTSYEAIQKVGVNVEEYFVYYDERHTCGVDILQAPSAINLVTIDETLLRRNFFQAILRLRQFFFNQTVELVILESSKNNLIGNGETFEGVLESFIKNQAILISKDLFRGFKQEIEDTFKQAALKILYSFDKQFNLRSFSAIEPFLVGKNENSPYEAFGRLDKEVSTIEALVSRANLQSKKWKSQGLPLTAEMIKRLNEILAEAKASELLQKTIHEPGSETLGVEQEVSVQVQQEVQEEVQEEMEQELQTELMRLANFKAELPRNETSWAEHEWEKLIRALENGTVDKIPFTSPIASLGAHLDPAVNTSGLFTPKFSYRHPYHLIFSPLKATQNFAQAMQYKLPLLHKAQRPADQIFLFMSKDRMEAILFSSYEGLQLKNFLNGHKGESWHKNCWLIQPDGSFLADKSQPLPRTKELEDILLRVNAFNGNVDYLDRHPHETTRWLSESCEGIANGMTFLTKGDYLKLKTAGNRKQNRILKMSAIFNPGKNNGAYQQQVEHLSRLEHNRLSQIESKDIPFVNNEDIIQRFDEYALYHIVPQQVSKLLINQYSLLAKPELVAAIPKDRFNIELMTSKQVPLFAQWQVEKIGDSLVHLHELNKSQVNLIDTRQVNKLKPIQFSWLTSKELLACVENVNVQYVNPEEVNQLSDVQIPYMEREQIPYLKGERLHLLHDHQLPLLGQDQIRSIKSATLIARLSAAQLEHLETASLSLITQGQRESITSASLLNRLPHEQLARLNVGQIPLVQLSRIPELSDEQLGSLSSAQLGKLVDPAVIKRLAVGQLEQLSKAGLALISTGQLERITSQKTLQSLPESLIPQVNQDQAVLLTRDQQAYLPTEKIDWLDLDKIQFTDVALIQKLNYAQILKLDWTCYPQLSRQQVREFPADNLGALTVVQYKDLSDEQMAQIQPTQTDVIPLLPHDRVIKLSADCLEQIKDHQLAKFEEKDLPLIQSQTLLQRLNATQIPLVDEDQAKLLTRKQQSHLPSEKIDWLEIGLIEPEDEALIQKLTHAQTLQLKAAALAKISAKQVQEYPSDKLESLPTAKLAEISDAQLSRIAATQTTIIHELSTGQLTKVPALCLSQITEKQVQQFPAKLLPLLPDDKLALATEAQLAQVAESQAPLIQRLSTEQLASVSDDCLKELSTDQLMNIRDFEMIRRLPGKALPKLSMGTLYAIPLKSLLEIETDKIRHCTFFQKLVLSIHHFAMGIFSLIISLICLIMTLPAVVFGYSITPRWKAVVVSLQHLKRSFTIWLPPT